MKIRRPVLCILSLQLLALWGAEQFSFFESKQFFQPGLLQCDGVVKEFPQVQDKETVLIVDLRRCDQKAEGVAQLKVRGAIENLYPGDRIRFRASFRPPTDFHNPGAFKLTRHYRMKGISALGFVSDPRWIARFPSSPQGGIAFRLEKIRSHLRQAVSAAGSEAAQGLILSLSIGETARFPPANTEAFRKTGISHILSISGLHITLVSFFFYFFFRLLAGLPIFSRSVLFLRLSPLLSIPFLWIYVACAHWPVSAVRAGVMASLVFVGLSVWRRLDMLSAWGLAAFLILCLSPLSFYSASFQLSFGAILFLILFFPRWLEWRKDFAWPRFFVWLADLLVVSFLALLGVGPLLLFHFHTFSLIGLFSNLIVVPLFNFLLMPLVMAGWLLSGWFGFQIPFFWKTAGLPADAVLKMIDQMAVHSDWGIFYGAISLWQILLYYSVFAVLLLPRARCAKKWKLALVAPMMALVLWGGKMPADGKLRITFVDVGQGDACVVQLPNGKVWVIDGGGIRGSDWDVGKFIVAPFLWEEGIHKIEYLFLSHPHHDHYKGLGFLAENFGPKILFENGDPAPEGEIGEWEDFLKRIEAGKVERRKITRATAFIEEAGVQAEFLMPEPLGTISHFDTNDNSIVLRLTFGGVSFLLPGDLMEAGELLLLESKPNLKADVLKVGHHGSDTSTTEKFLRAVAPKVAVMSVGAYNSYGMPSIELVSRLKQKGISLYRTDLQGAVTFISDGKKIDVRTFVP